jgi:hypothetical protein
MSIEKSMWITTGNRKMLNINSLVPMNLFNAYKKRVTDDGGVILNEASLLDEITFLVLNGMWRFITFYASPEWGIKYSTEAGHETEVIKMYGLGLTDFTAFDVNGKNKRPITLDASVNPPELKIWIWDGGTLLRAEKTVIAQISKQNPFLFSATMRDLESSDGVGISVVACRPVGNPNNIASIAVERATVGTQKDFGYRHFAAKVYPVTEVADWVRYERVPYAANIKNASLISPAAGLMYSYENGVKVATQASPSGMLVDSSVEPLQMNIGAPDNNVASWSSGQKMYGSISRLRCLSFATDEQAALISARP